jgi:hypothetical protein
VCYHPPKVSDVSIAEAIGQLNKVDIAGSAVQTARDLGICFGDRSPEAAMGAGASLPLPITTPLVPTSLANAF